ncbi:radical SAM protein [candidate division KSB1 bacterium]|nr:radical SAM protein [candidate division KSB1 bacterium]
MKSDQEFLIITPPVLVPTQVPVGAFMLASALAAQHFKTVLYDASIEYFHFILKQSQQKFWSASAQRRAQKAVHYFQNERYFHPHLHRTHINNLHHYLGQWSTQFDGWQVGLTDISWSQIPPHGPSAYYSWLSRGGRTPFTDYIHQQLIPNLQKYQVHQIGISLTYLSQIYFTLELRLALKEIGITPYIGGALIHVLENQTGKTFDFNGLFNRNLPVSFEFLANKSVSRSPIKFPLSLPILHRPFHDYFTPVPIIPFPLSRGCYWNRCLFCPDQDKPFQKYEITLMEKLLQEVTNSVGSGQIIFNICDSSVPTGPLNQLLPFFKANQAQFYGFFRFEKTFLNPDYLQLLYESGARLLQFGLESGSQRLLNLFQKGFDLEVAEKILNLSHQTGLKNYIYLLFGLPTETEADREMTLEFMQKNHSAINFLNLALFNLPKFCDISNHPAKYHIQLVDAENYQQPLQLYVPFTSCDGPIRPQARDFIQYRLQKEPAIRQIVKNTPARVRIDHAVFFEE